MHVGQIRLHPLIGLQGATTFVANDWRQMGGEYFHVFTNEIGPKALVRASATMLAVSHFIMIASPSAIN